MKCPNCNETLLMAERHGVEIDYCPACRGVWLDKGELDKILEYGAKQSSSPDMPAGQAPIQPGTDPYTKPYRDHDDDHKYNKGYDPKYGYPKQHKKKSFLDDFFDF